PASEASEGAVTAVANEKSLDGDELPHDVWDGDLAALRLRRDAGCDDNGSAEQIAAPARVVFLDRLAGVEADTNADIAVPDRPLDSDGALERPRRGAERGHETVAHRLDLASPLRLPRLP